MGVWHVLSNSQYILLVFSLNGGCNINLGGLRSFLLKRSERIFIGGLEKIGGFLHIPWNMFGHPAWGGKEGHWMSMDDRQNIEHIFGLFCGTILGLLVIDGNQQYFGVVNWSPKSHFGRSLKPTLNDYWGQNKLWTWWQIQVFTQNN